MMNHPFSKKVVLWRIWSKMGCCLHYPHFFSKLQDIVFPKYFFFVSLSHVYFNVYFNEKEEALNKKIKNSHHQTKNCLEISKTIRYNNVRKFQILFIGTKF